MADALEGTQLAHTFYGEPKSDVTMSAAWGNVAPAPPGLPYKPKYVPDRSKKCKANDDTCNGWRLKDSPYCPAHAGLLIPNNRLKRTEDAGESPADA